MTFKKYLQFIIKQLKNEMLLNEWSGTVTYKNTEHKETAMDINVDESYLRFSITVYKPVAVDFKEKKYADIVEYATHELCHIITEPLYRIGIDAVTNPQVKELERAREQATQRMCNIIYKSLNLSNYQPDERRHGTRRNLQDKKRRTGTRKVRKSNRRVPSSG